MNLDEQRSTFADMWSMFSAQIANGQGRADFPNKAGMRPQHSTTISRLPAHISQTLYDLVADICPGDYHYPVGDIHFTYQNIDALLEGHENPDWQQIGERLGVALELLPELRFRAEGLNVFPTTVYVQLFEESGALEAYRQAIVGAVASVIGLDDVQAEAKAVVPGVAFANLIRFKRRPSADLVGTVSMHRSEYIGTFSPLSLELVTTNRLLSADGTIRRDNIAL